VLQVSDGILPNIFELDNQAGKVSVFGKVMRFVGLQDEEKKEEEKKEDFNEKMSKFKKFNLKLDFKPEEIIKFYVQPSEFLKTKFNEQWTQITDIEIKRSKEKYADKIKQINLNF
jgi:hypothetical protein